MLSNRYEHDTSVLLKSNAYVTVWNQLDSGTWYSLVCSAHVPVSVYIITFKTLAPTPNVYIICGQEQILHNTYGKTFEEDLWVKRVRICRNTTVSWKLLPVNFGSMSRWIIFICFKCKHKSEKQFSEPSAVLEVTYHICAYCERP